MFFMMHFDGFPHVLKSQQFSRQWLEEEFFPLTDIMQRVVANRGCQDLEGYRMVTFFYQPSTRTRVSFELAMDYLGGKVAFSTENAREYSSGAKGENLTDTLRTLDSYKPDVIVIRYDYDISDELNGYLPKTPILNAGDRGPGQHPTQALLDIRTIQQCMGRINGLRVVMGGDLQNGRTARSLSYLLGKFEDIAITFVSPHHLQMGSDIKDYLRKHHVKFSETTDLRQAVKSADVIYQTRIQTECGADLDYADHALGYFKIDGDVMENISKHAIIMHPLPKRGEIAEFVDQDPRAVYFTHQIESGLYTRMALLKMILGKY